MPHPLPRAACWHHTPGGLLNSSICGTLQHIMHEPQARPGTRRGVGLASIERARAASGPTLTFAFRLGRSPARMLESKDHWQVLDSGGALDLTFALRFRC